MFRENCLVCNSKKLEEIVDLGSQPFADTFIPQSRASESDAIYPLTCDLCLDCGQVQTKCITNPQDRYAQHDYSYTSSNSSVARKHWEELAGKTIEKFGIKDKFVVEVGSNDGYLSEQFAKAGNRVMGVDPSPYMARLAEERGVQTRTGLFGKEIAQEIEDRYGKADMIIANNVFNHSNSPRDFAEAVSGLLAENGRFMFEQPYWHTGVKSGKFDQIYHEHVSYFLTKSIEKLLNVANMKITDARVVDYHGGSLKTVAEHFNSKTPRSIEAQKLIEQEITDGMFNPKTYKEMMKSVIKKRDSFLKKVYEIRAKEESIIAVGAAAKGNTFLNFYNLDHSVIDFVTDSSPHKQGKLTPATRIPIVGDDVFKNYDKVHALILSWNIANMIKPNLLKINPNIEFLVPEE